MTDASEECKAARSSTAHKRAQAVADRSLRRVDRNQRAGELQKCLRLIGAREEHVERHRKFVSAKEDGAASRVIAGLGAVKVMRPLKLA